MFVYALRNLLRSDIVCERLRLEEDSRDSTTPRVELQAGGRAALLLRLGQPLSLECKHHHPLQLEANRRFFPLFNEGISGITASCDYVLLCQRAPDDYLTVLLCELKSKATSGAFSQIQNTAPLVESLLQSAAWHTRKEVQRPPRTVWRAVVFKYARPLKSGLRLPCPYEPQDGPLGPIQLVHLGAASYPLEWLCA